MRLSGSDKGILVAFGALAVASIAIKAEAGPPRDGWAGVEPNLVAADLRARLEAEGFVVSVIPLKIQSPIILGQRGGCRVSVRDARGGKALMSQFAQDAAEIGPVHYLYKRRTYDTPPAFGIRLGRLETELLGRFGAPEAAHIPVAIAASRECPSSDFGVGDVAIAV